MTDVTQECSDGSPHVFLEDGGETPGGVSCAICDLDYETWLARFHPKIAALAPEARAEAMRKSLESPC